MKKFNQLGLSSPVIEALEKLGFETPTPVQEQAIPILLENDPTDFIGLAQTGTGKTAAFGLPLIELIDSEINTVQALIMAPTRELGQQTAKQLLTFAENHKRIKIEVVYGGAPITKQMQALRKAPHILVATPGRLQDLIKRKAVKLSEVRYVVLDEADEMLNMGFKEAIDNILSFTWEHRKIWLFSATMPKEIRQIIKKYMESPREVSVNAHQHSNEDIAHQFIITKTANKIPALRRFLDIQPEMRGIMFCRTKRETQEIADQLSQMGYGVEALHGDLSQAQRDAVMKRFKARSMQLLVATDVAARGIDVSNLTHVIHHTLPDQLESYTHRSGRTGRAGKKGISLVFINAREGKRISELEKRIKVRFEPIEVPSLENLKSTRITNWANLIVNTQIDDQADEILQQIKHRFGDLSKDDLLKRLITTQLDHIMTSQTEDADLNERVHKGSSSKPTSRGASRGKDVLRFFINVGTIDGVTKADLIHFLSDISKVDRAEFTDVTLQKNCSFFSVPSQHEKKVIRQFKGVQVDSRAIRVNRDDERETGRRERPERKQSKPKSNRQSKRRS